MRGKFVRCPVSLLIPFLTGSILAFNGVAPVNAAATVGVSQAPKKPGGVAKKSVPAGKAGSATVAKPKAADVTAAPALPAAAPPHVETNDPVLKAMQAELQRSFTKLKTAADAPVYFIGYRVYDEESYDIIGEFGALRTDKPENHKRTLDVELRVGNPHMDNTHATRSSRFQMPNFDALFAAHTPMPLDDDEAAIRTTLWERTDAAFKSAQSNYTKVMTEKRREGE